MNYYCSHRVDCQEPQEGEVLQATNGGEEVKARDAGTTTNSKLNENNEPLHPQAALHVVCTVL